MTALATMFLREGMDAESARSHIEAVHSALVVRRSLLRGRGDFLAQRAVQEALYLERRTWLDYYGVVCPCCRGEGETVPDELRISAELVSTACELCRGQTEVLLDEAAKWIGDQHDDDDVELLDWLHDTNHEWMRMRSDAQEKAEA